ncbi:hypothetical protein CRE_02421 [Caenorhabditis remanei]|uniref:Uncharacterized protein n=1 Tax=Caenorhabditis remanei TaxID=31234 RepID=E3MIP5_CAERE|nr:hypothetical protein CRE_02421 [Caenorhabditis remanei]
MSAENSVSEILYAKVFTNQHLLENILSYISDDFRKNLNVRLLNKRINNTFLRQIRRNHQKMKIEYAYDIEHFETRLKDYIYINYRKINNQDVLPYFIFLNTVVGVKAEKITTRRLWMLEKKFKRRLHDLIHSQLIGTNEICDGCVKCSNIAQKCLEYGPLRFSTLQTMIYSKNYKKLHVTDKLFENIAEYCISKSKNKDECFKELDKTILSTISCDKLAIWVNESRIFPEDGEGLEYDHRHMPREVIDIILRKWNVKSIKLSMLHITNEQMCSVEWLQYNYFTRVRLNDPYLGTKQSDLKFNHVEVSLSYSQGCVRGLGNLPPETNPPAGYDNFIPNIRRMFPTDQISMELPHWYFVPKIDIEKKMSTILQVVSMEQQHNLSLDIKFFVKSGIVKKLNEETKREELLGVASGYVHQEKRLHCFKKSSLSMQTLRFQVRDTVPHSNLKFGCIYQRRGSGKRDWKTTVTGYPNFFVNTFLHELFNLNYE